MKRKTFIKSVMSVAVVAPVTAKPEPEIGSLPTFVRREICECCGKMSPTKDYKFAPYIMNMLTAFNEQERRDLHRTSPMLFPAFPFGPPLP